MEDMYHTCRWCKHFSEEDDRCCKDLFYISMDVGTGFYSPIDNSEMGVCIKAPENFYCKEWE